MTEEDRLKRLKLDAILSVQNAPEEMFTPPRIPNELFELYMTTKFQEKFNGLVEWQKRINKVTYNDEEIQKWKTEFVAAVFQSGLPKNKIPNEIQENWDFVKNGNDWKTYDFMKYPRLSSRLYEEFEDFFFINIIEKFYVFATNKYITEEINEYHRIWEECDKEKVKSDAAKGIVPIEFEYLFIQKFELWYNRGVGFSL